ncbi:unnamed protein product [Nezara viridula]|uniref:Uncharacterized protein n=1 Tax=Nezara viridula TaxID=85310 RepID=A0A9P0HRG1_NEZVI|nr:unnamed protein product [Nezara viridula]
MCCFLKKFDFLRCTLFLTLFLFLITFYPLYLLCDLPRLPLNCASKVLTTTSPKVLEEMLWAYTTLWSIKRMNFTRRSVCVPKAIVDELKHIFQPLSLCTINNLPLVCNYEVSHASLITPIQYPDSNLDGVHVAIDFSGKSIDNPKAILYSAKYMNSEFVLSENLNAFAKRAHQRCINSLNLDNFDSPLITVCVWIKKPNWFPVRKYFKRARENFFRYSLDMFRKHYRPLFIAIGDVRWAAETFESDDFVPLRTKSVGQLLAMMSLCNHTIIEPNPLSLWAAFWNQGFKIVYGLPQVWDDVLWKEEDWMLLNLYPNGSFPHYIQEDVKMLSPLDFYKF